MGDQMVFKRYELKYRMTRRQKDQILRAMEPYMVLDGYGRSSIRNLYYDTPDFRLIRTSLEKPVYKEKLRVRSYGPAGDGDPVFVELKKKYRSVVYKRRISLASGRAAASLGREIGYALGFYRELAPAVFLSYEREAFYERDGGSFRVTFDEEIRYRQEALTLDSDAWGTALLGPDEVLMELKTAGGLPMWMVQALSREQIRQTSFSKYGSAYQDLILRAQEGGLRYA